MTIGVSADIVISSGGACSGMEYYKTHRPLSEATQPFYTTRGASRAPFFIICGEAATTTLGLKGRQT